MNMSIDMNININIDININITKISLLLLLKVDNKSINYLLYSTIRLDIRILSEYRVDRVKANLIILILSLE